jgi:leucyl-tRNA synthetase
VIVEHLSQFSTEVHAKIQQIRSEKLNPTNHETEAIKDGIDTGLKAINPFSGEELPVWIGNYVMMEYGTGAVMSVPAHDERDFEFAQKFGLPIKTVIETPRREDAEKDQPRINADGNGSEKDSESAIRNPQSAVNQPFTEYGVMVDSGDWSGKTSDEGKVEMAEYAKQNGFGETATTFRIRDWGISRQRFWGAPIPIVYCDKCGIVPEKQENLPVELPDNAPFTGTGESPLTKVPEFYETTCPKCEGPAKRETDTMDTFVDSSWYFFRYLDPNNAENPFDPLKAAYWTPVDQYIGGDDHAVMHLIYARFWTKVMREIGLVNFDEPFLRLLTQGMVVGETFFDETSGKRTYFPPTEVNVERDAKGKLTSASSKDGIKLKHAIERMSKSKGNGVDPDEMVEIYGADATRLFVLFAAPVENELVWHESGIEGAVRFLQRVWRFVHKWHVVFQSFSMTEPTGVPSDAAKKLRQKTHQTIKRVQDSLESLQFNTPVAGLMELCNAFYDSKIEPENAAPQELYAVFEASMALTLMLAPFAPHSAEELFGQIVGNDDGMLANNARFPEYSPELASSDEIEIAVQVNGKLRSRIYATAEAANSELEALALADAKVKEQTDGKDIVKIVVVPKRLVNIVVRG